MHRERSLQSSIVALTERINQLSSLRLYLQHISQQYQHYPEPHTAVRKVQELNTQSAATALRDFTS